jgi:hypothetical protein
VLGCKKITNSYALAMLLMARKDETLNANISVENGCTGTKSSKRDPGHQDLSINTNIPSKSAF